MLLVYDQVTTGLVTNFEKASDSISWCIKSYGMILIRDLRGAGVGAGRHNAG